MPTLAPEFRTYDYTAWRRTGPAGLPQVIAVHRDADEIVPYEQSVRLTKALKSAGDDADLITVPGGKHAFSPDQMQQLWPQIFTWLKKHKIAF